MHHSIRTLLALIGVASAALAAAPVNRPNILFILADDLGLDGLSCNGSDVRKTPNLDKLAMSGTRFETCYAAPFVEKPVPVSGYTAASRAARARLTAVLRELNPAGGKTDAGGGADGAKKKNRKAKKQ